MNKTIKESLILLFDNPNDFWNGSHIIICKDPKPIVILLHNRDKRITYDIDYSSYTDLFTITVKFDNVPSRITYLYYLDLLSVDSRIINL